MVQFAEDAQALMSQGAELTGRALDLAAVAARKGKSLSPATLDAVAWHFHSMCTLRDMLAVLGHVEGD